MRFIIQIACSKLEFITRYCYITDEIIKINNAIIDTVR